MNVQCAAGLKEQGHGSAFLKINTERLIFITNCFCRDRGCLLGVSLFSQSMPVTESDGTAITFKRGGLCKTL